MSRFLIGIDLGTTNSALAYIDSRARGRPTVKALSVPQLVGVGEVAERSLLPSFLYLPGPHDLPPGACALPWDPDRRFAVGEFARSHGAKVPGRLVASAKSWLAHAGVDRTADLLPWAAPPDVPRVSPVEASARYLRHLADAWNHTMAKDDADARIEELPVVLTVPASFDDVARNLTVEAARRAGLRHITLLEEPQAAFYSWQASFAMGEPGKRGREALQSAGLKPGMTALVVDVGGGTSDFSLIRAAEQEGELGFVRLAVGEHLLLGGDNMDLALAKFVEARLPQAGRLDAAGFGALTQACRLAKETLLAPNPPEDYTVTVVGRGRLVVGAALHTSLTPGQVRGSLFEGFFPAASFEAEPARSGRAGLHEMGLPYVHDPAITRHLALFLRQHGHGPDHPPDAILFNGGVFQPEAIRARLIEVMSGWFGPRWRPVILTSPSLDLAVAYGAAYYGWLRQTGGRRITGGLARSYYVGIDVSGDGNSGTGSLSTGLTPIDVLCVVPQHLEEGEEITLERPELELALGRPVSFPLYSSTVRADDVAGQLVRVSPRQLLRLPPLHTVLRGGKRSGTKRVPVKLAARLTEIGTLELFCVARTGENRWRLEFNTRDVVGEWAEGGDSPSGPGTTGGPQVREAPAAAPTDVFPEELLQRAAELIGSVFAEATDQPARELTRALENALGATRGNWPTGLCRRLADFLAEVADRRRLSPAHLSRWYNLVGYCLRPGFGDPLDPFRVDQLWKSLHSPVKQSAVSRGQAVGEGGADYWIMWRRVAGGLNVTLQHSLLERLRPVLLPAKGGRGPAFKPGANELAEMWRAAASLERLDPKIKEQLGQVLLRQVRRSPVPPYTFWSLTRLGSRVLFYGPLNAVVHPQIVEAWLNSLLGYVPGDENERQQWLFCLCQIARSTNQRALDVSEEVRSRVRSTLETNGASAHSVKLVTEGAELESADQKQLFGESLPIGLRLVTPGEGA